MPRIPRKKSESGIYHVMLRGINKQIIFNDDSDKQKFIELLKKYKAICSFDLFAYCLMNNHIHLLLKENELFPIDNIMKRVATSYVIYFNEKYHRIGSLFQDRFRSEPVEDDTYFLTVLRYIHQNPIKAGICDNLYDYQWCSFDEYKLKSNSFVNTEFALGMVSYDEFMEFIALPNDDYCLDDEEKFKKNKDEWYTVYMEISGGLAKESFADLSLSLKEQIIINCKNVGMPVSVLSELTGSTNYFIRKTK